jgi:tungstate transport system substrate-binding protein
MSLCRGNPAKRVFLASVICIILALSVVVTGCAPAAKTPPAAAPAAVPVTVPVVVPVLQKPSNPEIIMASTTSTGDSGLMDVLIPIFQQKTGYTIKPIYVGSGAAMTMGERGDADVLLVHAPDSEVKFMEAGHGVSRKLVMHNDFIIIGPAGDPAGIKGVASAIDALKKIAAGTTVFISRGDKSGTDQLEKKLWTTAGITPKGQAWYQETGQGMGATLSIASEKAAYTITDRATYLATKKNLSLDVLVQGDPVLLNIYHVIDVNSAKSPRINAMGAKAFVAFMVDPSTQEVISKFGIDKYGQALFFPDAGKKEADLGSN